MNKTSHLSALAACVPWLGGCAAPTLDVHAAPRTSVHLDGRPLALAAPRHTASVPLPYYGAVEVGVAPSAGLEHLDGWHLVQVDEPFSPWIFPLDFVLEFVTYPFHGDRYVHRVDVGLQPRHEAPPGVEPPGLAELRERARQALLQR